MSSQSLIYVAVIVVVVARFLLRELRERKLRLRSIFVLPAVLGVIGIALAAVAGANRSGLEVLIPALIGAMIVGTALGLAVSRYTTSRAGPPGYVLARGSGATVALWLGALALRAVARLIVGRYDAAALMIANAALMIMLATALAAVRYRLRESVSSDSNSRTAAPDTTG